jgi:phenylalanyl-tRNA synthetase beta chain
LKFSYNWLCELVPGLASAPGELAELITMKTAECEGIEATGALLGRVCAARVESVEPLPNGHNVKATIDAGPYGRTTVVCGAPNCRAGVIAAYAPVGRKVIQGVESDGMLASGAELGINRDHAGILELVEPAGSPIPGCMPDSIIEIDNKSITHRPDLWGHVGMAREVAAIVRQPLSPPKLRVLSAASSPIRIVVEDEQLCPRYSALAFENVTVQPSPLWLQYRLTAIGLNPINNIVDMTNYLMAELAQPMHAFDAGLLRGDTILVRPARRGERFRALNEEEYTLDASNLVIADAAGAIGLAGVIGGMDSKISEKTTRLVLESANFLASSVRKTSAALKLRTDASMRFEKAQDPANTVRALARAIDLLEELSPGIRVVGMADQQRAIPLRPPIELPLAWLERKLGRAVPPDEVRDILERLEFGVKDQPGGVFSVTVPSWRATKDITVKDDLVEEVGRMIGYGTIPPRAPLFPAAVPPPNPKRKFQHEVRELFAGLGFTEVSNYSFVSEESLRAFGLDPARHVRVANPIASDQALLRTSLVPGLRKNIADNQKHRDAFRLFEIGLEIHQREAGLPDEIPRLVATIYDRYGDGIAGLFEVKRAAECLMPGAKVCPAEAGSEKARPFEHPARAADITWMGEKTGRLFELHPALLDVGRAAILDLDLRVIERLASRHVKYGRQYAPIRRYPSSAFDLSVIAAERELAGTLETRIAGFAGELVESIEFLRQYSGPPLAPGQKSVSFRVTAGSPERTLSSEEVGEIRQRIIEGMRGLGYDLRL